ncbi:hypothetical protein BPA01_21570 [Brevibacillus parabrevis]|uniref:Uncharacterized protein n=1 Tax=Brevibacillus parabrevis TaxID=54914 RepID=A0A4Y3PH06_BREPA|nr:hypothetical protein BPA01_21570 [Brevibacillus parabrevis]
MLVLLGQLEKFREAFGHVKKPPQSGEAVVDYKNVSSPLISRVSSRDRRRSNAASRTDSYPLELAPFRYSRKK